MNRRDFLKGLTVGIIGGIALADAEKTGVLYFFPSEIKITNKYTDSKFFVQTQELEDRTYGVWKLKTEFYGREEFYELGGRAMPLRVEYQDHKPLFKINGNRYNINTDKYDKPDTGIWA